MEHSLNKQPFAGQLVMLGFGCIGQGILPLLLRHIALQPAQLYILAVAAGVIWAMQNPGCGVVEPDEMPYVQTLDFCRPYLGEVVGVYGDWTPRQDRGRLFAEDLDYADPWQFKNFRVS